MFFFWIILAELLLLVCCEQLLLNRIPTSQALQERLRQGSCRRRQPSPGCFIRCEFYERQPGNPLYAKDSTPVVTDNVGRYINTPHLEGNFAAEGWTFSLVQPESKSFGLSIDHRTGQLNASEDVDYDTSPAPLPSEGNLTASNGNTSVECHISVNVLNWNESPLIRVSGAQLISTNSGMAFSVSETSSVGSTVLRFDVTDPDVGDVPECHTNFSRYKLELNADGLERSFEGQPFPHTQIFGRTTEAFGLRRSNASASTWEIYVLKPLDFEYFHNPSKDLRKVIDGLPHYELPIFCRGSANGSDFSESFLPIMLGDVNEFIPNCTASIFPHRDRIGNDSTVFLPELSEPLPAWHNGLRVIAQWICKEIESPAAGNLSAQMLGGGDVFVPLFIHPKNLKHPTLQIYAIAWLERLDYERRSRYDLSIVLRDTAQGKNFTRSIPAKFTVIILDEDEPPEFTQSLYNISLKENTLPGTSVFTFPARDPDADNTVTFQSVVVRVCISCLGSVALPYISLPPSNFLFCFFLRHVSSLLSVSQS